MPVWHEATRKLQEEGKLELVGIIEEQHPDRCRLFMQWKKMEWPILVDSLNLLGVSAVPISLLVDEHGVVRGRVRDPVRSRQEIADFLAAKYPAPEGTPSAGESPDVQRLAARVRDGAPGASDALAWMAYGDALFLRGRAADGTRTVDAYSKAVALGGPPAAHFRRGVALRRRHESKSRQDGDLQEAFSAWGSALSQRPNQYIWRRRIQQYGPRLEKPYAFYDWVELARRDIRKRGETPSPLVVEPGGAEIAHPDKLFREDPGGSEEPDPGGRILRDKQGLVRAELGVVPATVERGKATRVHLILRPDHRLKSHWNNEAGKLVVWVDPPEGVKVDRKRHAVPNARRPVSSEPRKVEFEVRVAGNQSPGKLKIPAYALYYVCEDVDGVCRYLRQDFEVSIEVK